MRVVRAVVGLAMIAAGALLATWAIYNLIRIGNCASGGPYVSARPCPPGTELKILALVGSAFMLLAGAVVSPLRGTPRLAWGLGFLGLAAGVAVGALGPTRPQAGGTALTVLGLGLGGVFLAVGLLGLVGGRLPGRLGVRARNGPSG
jgi:hypothetical protein